MDVEEPKSKDEVPNPEDELSAEVYKTMKLLAKTRTVYAAKCAQKTRDILNIRLQTALQANITLKTTAFSDSNADINGQVENRCDLDDAPVLSTAPSLQSLASSHIEIDELQEKLYVVKSALKQAKLERYSMFYKLMQEESQQD